MPSHSRTSVALVLAIDPAFTHHDALQRLADDSAAHEIVFASSCDEALAIISRHIPDLVVFPIFCSDADEVRISARVSALSHADDPRTLAIPLLASTVAETPSTPARWFYWFKPRDEPTEGPRDPGAFADEIRDYLETGPGELSTGLFREFSAAAGDSLAERVAAAARTIVARLSGLRPEHVLVWRQRMSLPRWVRPAGAALMLAVAAAPALARASLARLTRPKAEHPLVPGPRTSPPPWLQSAGAALLLAVSGVGTSESGEALWSQTGYPLVRPQRESSPRWRRSVGAALCWCWP